MDQPTAPGAPRTPLDTERERLRKQGYTDAEVSQILISRAAGGQQQADGAGHGPMTGVASNVAAASTYAKNFVPSMKADLAAIRDEKVDPDARNKATLSLIVKVIVVLVIGYIVLQEFSQLRSSTARATAEACSARQKLIVDNMPTFADPKSQIYQEWKRKDDEFRHDCMGY